MNHEKNQYIDCKTLSSAQKQRCINDNLMKSNSDHYKVCLINSSIKIKYTKDYKPKNINDICRVQVHYDSTVNIAEILSDRGINSLKNINPDDSPVLVQLVNKTFNGRNFESDDIVYDNDIMLRSNFSYVIKKQYDLFEEYQNNSPKKTISSIYSFPVTFIRNNALKLYSAPELFKTATISIIYDKQNDLIKVDNDYCLTSNDFLHLRMYYDTIFQSAISARHKIIILSLIDESFNVPYNDQIKIFNLCIMLYGHLFKSIIICIPRHESQHVFSHFDEHIIKPQILTNKIEVEYIANKMTERLKNE